MDINQGYKRTCPLCRLAHDGEILTRVYFEDNQLIIVDCVVCRVPMAVLKTHRQYFEQHEQDLVRRKFRELLADWNRTPGEDAVAEGLTPDEIAFQRLFPERNKPDQIHWVIDWEQRQIPDHPHCHLRPFPFPKTERWETL